MSLADELAATRAEIARLKLRAARLRALILAAPRPVPAGRWCRVVVRELRLRQLDPALLPPDIRSDPRFQRDRVVQSLCCLPVSALPAPVRPGWPIRRLHAQGTDLH